MRYYKIEVDERIWNYLKKHAEPFIDTPNSVLSRILFQTHDTNNYDRSHKNTLTGPAAQKDIHTPPESISDLSDNASTTSKTLLKNKTSQLELSDHTLALNSSVNGTDTSFNTSDLPQALSQILDVLFEIKVNGLTRKDATHLVAKRRDTSPFTVMDKYCRQLNKKAHEIDKLLLNENGIQQFKALLVEKFPQYTKLINDFFQKLLQSHA